MKEIAEWTFAFRDFWDEKYDQLDMYLQTLQATDTARPHEAAGGHEAPDQAANNGVRVQASPKLLAYWGTCARCL